MSVDGTHTLTVYSTAGLCNRLRVLLSGYVLAAVTGRTFCMWWLRTPACTASFEDLFVNHWHVEDLDPAAQAQIQIPLSWTNHKIPDLLHDTRPAVTFGHLAWLVQPARYPGHAPLFALCIALIDALAPAPAIAVQVEAARTAQFRPQMIGVHLRRGDFWRDRPDIVANTAAALTAVDGWLDRAPAAGIFLATDDGARDLQGRAVTVEGVVEIFRQRYGARLITSAPVSRERHDPRSVQAALVDLLLLRQTNFLVGTAGSTFSEFAGLGRTCPQVFCGGPAPAWRFWMRLGAVTGVNALVSWTLSQTAGRPVPATFAYLTLRRYQRRLCNRRR